MSAPKLFSPGPVMVKENVRQALMHYDICHRGAEFEDLFARTTAKINKLFKADDSYRSVDVYKRQDHIWGPCETGFPLVIKEPSV